MSFVVADRVQETCAAPGTGVVTLLGASNGYQSFSSGIGANNTTYYTIVDQSGTNWEVGLGTVGATGLTLTRTTVLSSSNSGSLVNFSAGIQNVWGDYPAGKAVYKDSIGTVTVPQLATNSTTSTTPVLSFNASNSGFAAGASILGSYLQTVLQNKSGTAGASTNYVVSNDLGTDSSYYGEFGMNSSVFSASTPTDFFSINNGVYFSGHDGDITFGSGNNYKSYFAWGASGQSAHVINASGALGFSTNLGTTPALSGTTGYGTAGQVPVSGGSGNPVAWSSTPTLTGTNFSGIPYSALTGTVPTWNQNTTGQAGSVANSITFNNGGAGAASGQTYNGSNAYTISYNTIGAQPTLVSGTNIKTINGNSLLGSGNIAVGKVLQVVNVNYSTAFSTTNTTDTATGLNASITPLFSTSKILILITANCRATATSGNCYFYPTVYRNTSTLIWSGFAQGGNFGTSTDFRAPATVVYLDSPATTSLTNYLFALNASLAGSGVYLNQGGGGQSSTITLMEIGA